MFGSVFRMKPKSGMAGKVREQMQSSRRPAGMKTAYMLEETASGDVWGFAVFEDEKSYRANASAPEQDARYQTMRAMLDADPEWHDGTIEQEKMG